MNKEIIVQVLHEIDEYFDNSSNTLRGANNLIQSIYEKLSSEVKDNSWQPDWSILPEDMDWIALDADGGWRAYSTEPLPNHFMWSTGDDSDYLDLRCSVLNKYNGDWKDSLRKRP